LILTTGVLPTVPRMFWNFAMSRSLCRRSRRAS
jgi:hypothetical protein